MEKAKKLVLKKHSLRSLSPAELGQVAGGYKDGSRSDYSEILPCTTRNKTNTTCQTRKACDPITMRF